MDGLTYFQGFCSGPLGLLQRNFQVSLVICILSLLLQAGQISSQSRVHQMVFEKMPREQMTYPTVSRGFQAQAQQSTTGRVVGGIIKPGQSSPGLARGEQNLRFTPASVCQQPLTLEVDSSILEGQIRMPSRSRS